MFATKVVLYDGEELHPQELAEIIEQFELLDDNPRDSLNIYGPETCRKWLTVAGNSQEFVCIINTSRGSQEYAISETASSSKAVFISESPFNPKFVISKDAALTALTEFALCGKMASSLRWERNPEDRIRPRRTK